MNIFKSRFEIINAVLIAVISLSTAVSVWRTNVVGSNAADASRQGLIDAVKKQAFDSENYRKMYEEAGFAYQYAVKQAEVHAVEADGSPAAQERASNLEKYLLPNLQLLAEPLATDKKYLKTDGTYNLQKRYQDLQDGTEQYPDPLISFQSADSMFSEQRWLVIGSVLLAMSLFWLALAEVSSERYRVLEFLIGLGVYLFGVVWTFGVEIVFFFIRRGGA